MKTPSAIALMFLLAACGGQAPSIPARFVPHPDDASHRVEFFTAAPASPAPAPALVFLHGHQPGPRPGGRDFVNWGVLNHYANLGYYAVAISQPGYGDSSGPADFSGARTQHAIGAVLAQLENDHSIDPDQIVLVGISRGALAAGLAAANGLRVRGLVLISGTYDLAVYARADAAPAHRDIQRAIVAETGGDRAAIHSRSLIAHAAGLAHVDVLILAGELDDRAPATQAAILERAVKANGGHATTVVYPGIGHRIPVETRQADIDAFLERMAGARN